MRSRLSPRLAAIAEEALRLIEVDYEVLPPVMTVDAAMKPGAAILLRRSAQDGGGSRPARPTSPTISNSIAAT